MKSTTQTRRLVTLAATAIAFGAIGVSASVGTASAGLASAPMPRTASWNIDNVSGGFTAPVQATEPDNATPSPVAAGADGIGATSTPSMTGR